MYRVHGARATDLVLMAATEAVLVVVPAADLGLLWSVAIEGALLDRPLALDEVRLATGTAIRAVALALLLGPLSWAALGRGSIAAQLRDD